MSGVVLITDEDGIDWLQRAVERREDDDLAFLPFYPEPVRRLDRAGMWRW
jgi:hypothetical protein